jgi:hypothetical protein
MKRFPSNRHKELERTKGWVKPPSAQPENDETQQRAGLTLIAPLDEEASFSKFPHPT